MQDFEPINSPLQYIDTLHGIELWVKREDLIHPAISGNKWRKLKYFVGDFQKSSKNNMATFGGAFSNHIAATAALGKLLNISTTGFIRGEEIADNPTLSFARSMNMKIIPISRADYARKEDENFLKSLGHEDTYIIPEGGKGPLGIKGCVEILADAEPGFDIICCAAGTGTTFGGLLINGYQAKFRMYPALKNAGWLAGDVALMLKNFSTFYPEQNIAIAPFSISENYHFGGYGKVRPELIDFMNDFYRKYGLALDPVYTGKMFYGILDEISKGVFMEGSRIMAIHTGGLQGIKGMNERLSKTGKKLDYGI